jgi:hypothetical protein
MMNKKSLIINFYKKNPFSIVNLWKKKMMIFASIATQVSDVEE